MKRIGILYPSAGFSEGEIQKVLPAAVSLHVTRIRMKKPTYKEVLHMMDYVEEAASLLADTRVDIIAFSCTLGSLIMGKGYDQEMIARIQRATGLPATTTTTAVVTALRALDIQRLVMVSPYVKRMNEIEKAFLEDTGFEVLSYTGLDLDDVFKQYEVEPRQWEELVKERQDPRTDGYFVSCGGIRIVDVIEQMETELKKPVVTSNQALVWHCLRKIGVHEPIQGFGHLLKIPF